jgi:hypothetical protein
MANADLEFSMWMMFYIGSGNVGLSLIFTLPTTFMIESGPAWHVGAMFQFIAIMSGPVWLGALFYWACTGFQTTESGFIPQEPFFSTYRAAVDITFWVSFAQAICPILMSIDMAYNPTATTAIAAVDATTTTTTPTTGTKTDTTTVTVGVNGWKVFALVMNWCWVIATGVLMYLYVGNFRLWHDLLSQKVNDDTIRRWKRDHPDGKLPTLESEEYKDPFGLEKAAESPDAKKKSAGTKKSQSDYLDEKNNDA